MAMKRGWMLLVMVAVFGFLGLANAAPLEIIGTATYSSNVYNLIYEASQGLVWLDYTKGEDNWSPQVNWADGLGGSLTVNLFAGYSTTIDWTTDWRLPITDESKANVNGGNGYQGPDQNGYHNYNMGYNMVNSELGHLFYESLGNKGDYDTNGNSQSGSGLQNTGPFNNLQAVVYWSGTEYSVVPLHTWVFSFHDGIQEAHDTDHTDYALAVRPGDVVSAPVPEPATMLLLGSGLLGLFGLRRKLKK